MSDLNTAETLLPATTVRDRATQKTVRALRSRLYLYLKQWPQAEADATTIIADSTNYKLVNPYNTFFTQTNTTESVFELSYSLSYPNPMYGNWKKGGNYTPNTSIVTLLQDPLQGGNRNAILLTSGTSILGNLYPLSTGTNPVYVIRIAELFLIRAEARAEQDSLTGALSDLNAVRNRAGLANSTAATQADILLAIENERQGGIFTGAAALGRSREDGKGAGLAECDRPESLPVSYTRTGIGRGSEPEPEFGL